MSLLALRRAQLLRQLRCYSSSQRLVAVSCTPSSGCSSSGALRPTRALHLWWGYKEADLHRLARQRPWWENMALISVTVGIVMVSAFAYYFGYRVYYAVRPAGNDLLVVQRVDEKVFSRPDLSVALLRMAMHHLFSNTQTPFGDPMVAPLELKQDAMELLSFIKELHKEQPQFSIPDLWALACVKAVERLGGPGVPPTVGRASSSSSTSLKDDDLLKFPPSLLSDDTRDVSSLKRLFAMQKFSCDEAVAALAGARNVGYHAGFYSSLRREGPLAMKPNVGSIGAASHETLLTQQNPTMRKCTLDPFVFGGEYFNYLLDYHWFQVPVSELAVPQVPVARNGEGGAATPQPVEQPSGSNQLSRWLRKAFGRSHVAKGPDADVFRCFEDKRRRVEILVNPLSEDYIVTQKMKQTLNAKELREWEAGREAEREEKGDQRANPVVSPCGHITMQPIDVMLLDDVMTLGWVNKFSENELRFYNSFTKVLRKTVEMRYNVNGLSPLKL